MLRNTKPPIQKPTTSKKKAGSKRTGESLRKEALATVAKNIDHIEAAERGETPAAKSDDAKSTKPAGKSKKEKTAKPNKEAKPRPLSLLDHAAAILAKSPDPLNSKQITERVLASTDWKSSGLTPAATLYSAMIREIAEKKKESRFTKVERGLFAANK